MVYLAYSFLVHLAFVCERTITRILHLNIYTCWSNFSDSDQGWTGQGFFPRGRAGRGKGKNLGGGAGKGKGQNLRGGAGQGSKSPGRGKI